MKFQLEMVNERAGGGSKRIQAIIQVKKVIIEIIV
jgi:hypothetical protein